MRSITKILLLLLIVATSMTATSLNAFAAEESSLSAEIEAVYGGADGIVSMTFDDGNYTSALVIQELCEKYGLEASLMLIANRMKPDTDGQATPAVWSALFAKGNLEPQCHSMTHMGLRDSDISNLTADNYVNEIINSGDILAETFPDYDILCYAIPYGSMCSEALEVAVGKYPMIRSTAGKNQSLDPSTEFGTVGSWSWICSPPTAVGEGDAQLEYLKEKVDTASLGYWYCPITHGVGDYQGAEMSYSMADSWFAYVKEVKDRGDVWVTTASKATKYIRERQNSVASARLDGEILKVKVDMNKTTDDGFKLDGDVFNHPLTVRVELPDDYSRVSYSVGGECKIADSFKTGGKHYALIDVIPNTGEVSVLDASTATHAHNLTKVPAKEGTCLAEGTIEYYVCSVCNKTFNKSGERLFDIGGKLGEHELEKVEETAPTCTEEGIIAHSHCTVCGNNYNEKGKLIYRITAQPNGHSLRVVEAKNATCSEYGIIAHEHCKDCGKSFTEDGEELTRVNTEKLPHTYEKISPTRSVRDAGGAVATTSCKVCGGYFDADGNPLDGESIIEGVGTVLLIAIIAASVAVVGTGAFFTYKIIAKKKKK